MCRTLKPTEAKQRHRESIETAIPVVMKVVCDQIPKTVKEGGFIVGHDWGPWWWKIHYWRLPAHIQVNQRTDKCWYQVCFLVFFLLRPRPHAMDGATHIQGRSSLPS